MKRSYRAHIKDDTEPVLLVDEIWGYIFKLSHMVRYKDELQVFIEKLQLNEHGFVTPKEDIKVPLFSRQDQHLCTISIYHDISCLYWNTDGVLYAIKAYEYEFYLFKPQTQTNIYYTDPIIRVDSTLRTGVDSFSESPYIVIPIEKRRPVDEVPIGHFILNMDLLPRKILSR